MEFNLPTILAIITLATVLVNIVLYIRKPNEKQNLDISGLKKDVETNTSNIGKICRDIEKIKDNHLAHINDRLTRIETLLETISKR